MNTVHTAYTRHTPGQNMPRRQSKPCRYGESCEVARCPFRHPEKEFFTYARESEARIDMTVSSQNEKDLEIANALAAFEHSNELNALAAEIEFINWCADAPYVIHSHPDLGFFTTWDDAYDTLLRATYITP